MQWFKLDNFEFAIDFKKHNLTRALTECKTHKSNFAKIYSKNFKTIYQKIKKLSTTSHLEFIRISSQEHLKLCYSILDLTQPLSNNVDASIENLCDDQKKIATLCQRNTFKVQPLTKATLKNNASSDESLSIVAPIVCVVLFILVNTVLFALLFIKNSPKHENEAYNEEFNLRKISKRIQVYEKNKHVSCSKIIVKILLKNLVILHF